MQHLEVVQCYINLLKKVRYNSYVANTYCVKSAQICVIRYAGLYCLYCSLN